MKQIDLKVSVKFYGDGHSAVDFGPLVPAEFDKQMKQLNSWHNGTVLSLREAVVKWSHRHSRLTKREARRLERCCRRFSKAARKFGGKELAKPQAG